MKNWILKVGLTAAATMASLAASAATYYVSDCQAGAAAGCVAGSDSNVGTSASAPWKSTAKVASVFSSLAAGDQILFAKGGSWTNAGMGNLTNTKSTAASPIVFDSYSPSWGGTAKPILTEARAGTNLFYFTNSSNAIHREGFTVRNLALRGGGTGQWGIALYNDTDYVTLDNLSIDGFGAGVYCADYGNPPSAGSNSLQDNFTLRNSSITNNSAFGALISGCNTVLVENNTFDNNGHSNGDATRAPFNHSLYITGSARGVPATQNVVRGNKITNNSVVGGKCLGTAIVGHDYLQNWIVEDNTLYQAPGTNAGGCYGITFGPGNGSPEIEGEINLTIRRNTLVNMGYTSLGVASCQNCLIENNVIVQEGTADYIGIRVPYVDSQPEALKQTAVTIRNNSIYFYGVNDVSTGISVKNSGTQNVVESNLVYYGAGTNTYGYCFETDMPASSFTGWDYNLCYGAGSGGAKWSMSSTTLAAFTSAKGLDAHSRNTNPLISIPSSANGYRMTLSATSPAVNAGSPTLSALVDRLAVTRSLPDIGAFEYGGTADVVPPAAPSGIVLK